MEKEAEKAKNVCQAAKSAFTRAINTTQLLLEAKRPPSEIHDLIKKHKAYTMFLSVEEYPKVKNWMENCSFKYVDFSIRVNDYCQSNAINVQGKDKELTAASSEINDENEDNGSPDEVKKKTEIDQSNTAKHAPVKPLLMKHEKPKMATFNGDMRKYFIFKAEFQQAMENYCSERDAIAILHSCLADGISTDFRDAWIKTTAIQGSFRMWSQLTSNNLKLFSPAKTTGSASW